MTIKTVSRRLRYQAAIVGIVMALGLFQPVSTVSARPQQDGTDSVRSGFAVRDLTTLKIDTFAIGKHVFAARAEPGRLTLMCTDCTELDAIDVILGTSTDDIEARFRAGETTIEQIQSLCRERVDDCTLERVDLDGAVGWVSRMQSAGGGISTTVLFKQGDKLTIRSISNDIDTAYANGKAVRDTIGAQIVKTAGR